jgi:hypothetical protein
MARSAWTVVACVFLAGGTSAQTVTVPVSAPPSRARVSTVPQRETLMKMMKGVAIEFNETRLEDVMRYIADVTQADIEVMWQDDRNSIGLDKEMLISLKAQRMTALALVEKVLERATGDTSGMGGNTWQLSDSGTLQVGPKERLNAFKRVEIYNIQDLLLEVPNYTNVPEFDLQSVLQSTGQGGGSSQSPFRETGQQQGLGTRPYQERLQELIDLLTDLIEPEQWVDNGGNGASLHAFQGNLIINAPDYIHRQINGYPYWPSSATRVATVNNRRYVTIGLNTAIAQVVGFDQHPVTAVVGNRLIRSDEGTGGPGGSRKPGEKKDQEGQSPKDPK